MSSKIQSNVYLAIGFTILGFTIFVGADFAAKVLRKGYSIPELFFYNGLVACTILSVCGYAYRGWDAFKTRHLKWHGLRILCTLGISTLNLYALAHISLVTFYTIIFTGPLWVKIFAAVFLGEHVGWKRWIAVSVGFLVVLYMLQPGVSIELNSGTVAVLVSCVFFALSMTIVRKIGPGESSFLFGIFSTGTLFLVSFPLVVPDFQLPDPKDILPLILYGAAVGFGMLFTVLGYQRAPVAATVAPFHYVQIIWGALLDYFIFDDVPSLHTIIGVVVLIGVGVYIVRFEGLEARFKAAARPGPGSAESRPLDTSIL